VVHIYQNMSARSEYVFIADDFRSYRVTSAADTGQGSLRQALIDAQTAAGGPQLVDILLGPGAVIELKSPLEITKSITIEGNGVTLTRAASWTTVSDTSQLLRITGSAAEVLVRRLHFKDGWSLSNGGAIYNNGILSLESCIFSGNQTMSTNTYGGAVYSNNTLSIRGCTFYGNSSGSYGGAVYFYTSVKTLTLTGNLFYGNTAPNYPVVNIGSGTVSPSYNVVDLALGTANTQAGWAAGTGDTVISSPAVSGKSFRLLSGSDAAAKLPSPLPADYPDTDFYGDPISGGGAAGAVQAAITGTGYYLELAVNISRGGTIAASPPPDADGLVSGSFTITASPNPGYSLGYWLVNGVRSAAAPASLSGHTFVRAVFNRVVTVNSFADGPGSASTPGTLRHALANARDWDLISFSGVGTIELGSPLPNITESITLEGNGVTLTPAASWTVSDTSQLLRITGSAAEVLVRRLHFKDGRATFYSGAIYNRGILSLESCIFSGSQATGISSGAVSSTNTLSIQGCTFYGNSSVSYGGAVSFDASGKTLTLTGNLFYGNTALYLPVVYVFSGTANPSYNVVDLALGTAFMQAGWAAGTGDTVISSPAVSGKNFRLLSGSGAAAKLPASLPADYPDTDFYGDPISGGGAAGAVQAAITGYYLELSVNYSQMGTIAANPAPDADGMVSGSVSITAIPNPGYSFGYWLVNGVRSASAPTSLSGHTFVRAVFNRAVTVTSFADASTSGTLRHALTNAQDGDLISFSGAGTVELGSALPTITKSITIEGNGATLTPAASWTTVDSASQLLRITGSAAEVLVRGLHFKDGQAADYGAAILNDAGILSLESCIFSGNQTMSTGAWGGAVYSNNTLGIRGCTFYDNSSGYYGGAVYFGGLAKTLTLTGNLFYGNTAALSYPVVCVSSGTVSASHNVVDVAFGTANTQAGWAAGTGDTTFAALSITGDPFDTTTFAPVAALQTLLTTKPADFPATDFNGATRTFPGAPGAVK
jgi:hypothetical protein